uniref:hypothetical protein n=1 Tax=Ningiella ruwaisensis TaxID=2364274 RepID=UPI00109F42CF|nr:hypothetical protein [Ningiella ruwaisensis]
MKPFRKACIACLLLASGTTAWATDTNVTVLEEPSEKSVKFFKAQVENNRSLSNAINSLLSRYPDKTAEFVSIALSAYPEEYKEIISASVSTNPMFVDEIIMVANKYQVTKPAEIVEIAVNAEPSYAEVATRAACKYSPEYFNEIVRTAVHAEPDSADQIAQKLVRAYPSKTMEILVTTIKEVPFVGKYVLDALLATVEEDSEQSENMIIVSVEQLADYPDALERLVQLANEHDIDSDKVMQSAIKGGTEEKDIIALIEKHYELKE